MNPANALTCGPSRPILGILLLAMFLAFWGSLGVAAHYDPVQYDWRYRVISTLLSPCDNPAFYRVLSLGVAGTRLVLFPCIGYLHRRVRVVSPWGARVAVVALVGGSLALILAGLIVPQHAQPVLGVKRLHEGLAPGPPSSHSLAVGDRRLPSASPRWREAPLSPA
jgi:hypothetical protein